MKILKVVREHMPGWFSKNSAGTAASEWASEGENDQASPASHLSLAQASLRELLEDPRIPPEVRSSLDEDYREVQAMLEKLEHGHIHIAAFGRVSVGKSALLNALLGTERFSVSTLHGETTRADRSAWREVDAGGVFLIDTPGINEVNGEERERIAHEVASRSDLILFVVDGDITESELSALRILAAEHRPLILVLNKADRYREEELALVHGALGKRTRGLVPSERIVTAAARPAERTYILVDEDGNEREEIRRPAANVQTLRDTLWQILETEGMTLAALNATLFAGRLSDRVAQRIVIARRELAEKVVRSYCVGKGVAVALNPIPIADLVTAAAFDGTMIVHLARVYGIDLTRREAGKLLRTIAAQMAVLLSAVWATHLIASALKGASVGLSTLMTAAGQGAVAYYSTYVVGRAAERYFAHGKSWGKGGPKKVVREILESVNRDSILEQARADIFRRIKASA